MKLALLGCTPPAPAFAQSAARLGHEWLVAYDAGGSKDALREAVPTIRFRDDWENLLGEREIDALVVAGPILPEDQTADRQERRDDQLRKLVQAGVPLLVMPPVCEAIVGFELEMIRRDVKGIIMPTWARPLHPAVDAVAMTCQESNDLGQIELIALERRLPLRERSGVLAAFAEDALILMRFARPIVRLTASGATSDERSKPSLHNLVVNIDASSGFPLRWSVGPAEKMPGATITIRGSNQRVILQMPDSDTSSVTAPGIEEQFEPLNETALVLQQLEQAIEFQSQPAISWLDACRAVEAMEAIDRSLVRGRAIDLHNEEHSEQSSFKGIMASAGCLMLLGTLAAVSCAGALAVLFPPGKATGDDPARYGLFHSYWTWLQVCLIAPLALFLLAQLLSFGLSRHLKAKSESAESKPAD
jgi:hypothetical protein